LTENLEEIRLIGQSSAIQVVSLDIDCAARSDAKVLITGETGVGKEVAARLIHQRSARASMPFVTISCAGVPDSLLESELFGHVRGSFTGAYRDKPGLLEMAPNGTVFLDEVGEMSPRMQAMLLRFMETGEIQRIGSTRAHTRVDIRLITATNRDLQQRIVSGDFREDLYFRLNVIRLVIPPLRERREDVPLLIRHFLEIAGGQHQVSPPVVTAAAMDVLSAYRWPGNIREVRNVVERLVVKASGRPIDVDHLPADVFGPTTSLAVMGIPDANPSLARNLIVDALLGRLLDHGESFWSAVYPHFMSRDMTRDDLRQLVQKGLERSKGSYRALVPLFNMPIEDYKRFLAFLRKHGCHLPFQRFRLAPMRIARESASTDRKTSRTQAGRRA
jgi:transcriptional regulator with GAF, ATPase, and Fis domain